MLFMMRTTIVIATLPVLTSAHALEDAWIAAGWAFLGTVLLALVMVGLGLRFPRLTLMEYAERLLGKWPGKAVSMVVLWAFLHLAAINIRLYAEMIVGGFLPGTPLIFVISVMVLASAYAAYMGVEVIGRCADLFMPVFTAMLIISLGAAASSFRAANLQPVLGRGLGPTLEAAVVPTSYAAELMVVAVLIPSLVNPRRALPMTLTAVTAAALVLVMTAIAVVGVLGPESGARSVFPFLRMVRALQVTDFFERMEALPILAWGLGLFVSVSVFMFSGARGISQVFGVKDYRPLILPMAVHWVVLGFQSFEDLTQVVVFLRPRVFGPYVAVLISVPYGLLWLAYWYHRRRRSR
jgi:spore germination protein KB